MHIGGKLKVIIAGSRNFNNYNLLKSECDKVLSGISDVEIVSGTCKGADKLGEKYALERKYKLKYFAADWDGLGKMAGRVRNREMADYGEVLIAFWDGKSPGTRHMIEIANKNKLEIHIIPILL